jgi:hypothetical protein
MLYETMGTKLVRQQRWIKSFESRLSRSNTRLIDDAPYRNQALQATFWEARRGKRAISLCDMWIRLLIEDTDVRVHALLTFNVKDFHDVCRKRDVEIL